MRLVVVYDNSIYADSSTQGLRQDWGFACWVELGGSTVLFDSGAHGSILLSNMIVLGLDPERIDAVVLSHAHGDHTGGLQGLLDVGLRPVVYLPESFPASFKDLMRSRTPVVEVGGPAELVSGVYTTGGLGEAIVEQALMVETGEAMAVITGCAHPGVVNIVRRARDVTEAGVELVLGGFHLSSAGPAAIRSVGRGLAEQGVQRVAPCHCSGDLARATLSEEWGVNGMLPGVGWAYTSTQGSAHPKEYC